MYGSTRVQWVCCYFLELVTNDCFYLCLLPATIPLCIVAEAQPRAGDILQPPPAAWPSRYKSGSRHSTVSQEPDQHQRETVLLTLQRGWGWPQNGGGKRPRRCAPPVAETCSLEQPCTFRLIAPPVSSAGVTTGVAGGRERTYLRSLFTMVNCVLVLVLRVIAFVYLLMHFYK